MHEAAIESTTDWVRCTISQFCKPKVPNQGTSRIPYFCRVGRNFSWILSLDFVWLLGVCWQALAFLGCSSLFLSSCEVFCVCYKVLTCSTTQVMLEQGAATSLTSSQQILSAAALVHIRSLSEACWASTATYKVRETHQPETAEESVLVLG